MGEGSTLQRSEEGWRVHVTGFYTGFFVKRGEIIACGNVLKLVGSGGMYIAIRRPRVHHAAPVFSPVYLRHVGPTNLQHRLFFDVGKEGGKKALIWPQATPKPHPPVMP